MKSFKLYTSKEAQEDSPEKSPQNILVVGILLVVIVGTWGYMFFGAGDPHPRQSATAQPTPEMIKAQQEQVAQEQTQAEADEKAWEATKAGQLCVKHPTWTHDECTLILAGKVRIGMTTDQARASWGAPDDINRTTNKYGTSEQWVYGYNYLYFEDGVLDSISN